MLRKLSDKWQAPAAFKHLKNGIRDKRTAAVSAACNPSPSGGLLSAGTDSVSSDHLT